MPTRSRKTAVPKKLIPSRAKRKTVRVRVPASSANLGPGFDALGVALSLYNEIEMEGSWIYGSGVPPLRVEIEGEGARSLPRDPRNIAVQAASAVFRKAGDKPHTLRLKQTNQIPLASGMGSSAAACVGALVAANALLDGPLSTQELIEIAVELEGHPDNAVPAMLGGLCVSLRAAHGTPYVRLPWPNDLKIAVCVPELTSKVLATMTPARLKTHAMRALLPSQVSRPDAVFNIGRAAALVAAVLKREYHLLGEAMNDRLHQPARFKVLPGSLQAIDAARQAGAFGAALSGAGPGVLALAPARVCRAAARAMEQSFRRLGRGSRSFVLAGDTKGAELVT